MKHYFLGTAAGWGKKERLMARRAKGASGDTVALCKYLCQEYGGRQAIVTRNGRSAIAAALTYGVEPKGEVIVNGLTCRAVVQGVQAAGFTPVYADIDREGLNFTAESLAKVAGPKTRAMIVQNTLGNMMDIREVEKFAKERGLVLIEDLAHCVGRFYPDGREAGTVGELTVLSFGKEKSIDVVNGGAVVVRNSQIATIPAPVEGPLRAEERRARWYPTFGAWYRALSYVKLNGVLMRILLATGLVVKSAEGEVDFEKHGLADWQAKMALMQLRGRSKLKDRPLREFYLVRDRDAVLQELKRAGYFFDGVWYDKPVGPARYYAEAKFPERKCPVAVEVAEKIVNLPNYYSEKVLAPARKIILRHREGENG